MQDNEKNKTKLESSQGRKTGREAYLLGRSLFSGTWKKITDCVQYFAAALIERVLPVYWGGFLVWQVFFFVWLLTIKIIGKPVSPPIYLSI